MHKHPDSTENVVYSAKNHCLEKENSKLNPMPTRLASVALVGQNLPKTVTPQLNQRPPVPGSPAIPGQDDLKKVAGDWMRKAEDRVLWLKLGEAYVQQWTMIG
ncbi:hypothetical protein ACJJTC_016869 [Scirpophaga incertulas]